MNYANGALRTNTLKKIFKKHWLSFERLNKIHVRDTYIYPSDLFFKPAQDAGYLGTYNREITGGSWAIFNTHGFDKISVKACPASIAKEMSKTLAKQLHVKA